MPSFRASYPELVSELCRACGFVHSRVEACWTPPPGLYEAELARKVWNELRAEQRYRETGDRYFEELRLRYHRLATLLLRRLEGEAVPSAGSTASASSSSSEETPKKERPSAPRSMMASQVTLL